MANPALSRTSGLTFWVAPPTSETICPPATVDVPSLAVGAITADSLSVNLTNAAGAVASNSTWTASATKYLSATSINQYVVRSKCDCRDQEVTTWTRQGYVYLRLDGSGKAIYFFHNGETANGTLEIGIVTGLTETAYPSGTYYLLYQNTTLTSAPFSTAGYTTTNTDGQSFTFGVSGYDIYVEYNGVECVRFKEYRHMSRGQMAGKSQAGFGFRAIAVTPLTTQTLQSASPSTEINMADWWARAIAVTGSITSGTTTLTVSSNPGFMIGDYVIVEIGAEAGAGARGTLGVGGSWPAQHYATTAALLAATPAVNTFAWPDDTGNVYQYQGAGVWLTNTFPYDTASYYMAKALPRSLHARITNISGTTITLDTAAQATATNANVYLDNQIYFNDIFQTPRGDIPHPLDPITPNNITVVIPAGTYANGGQVQSLLRENSTSPTPGSGMGIRGQGQTSSFLISPKGMSGCGFKLQNCSGFMLRDFSYSGNLAGNPPQFYGLYWLDAVVPKVTATQYDAYGRYLTIPGYGQVDETTIGQDWPKTSMNVQSCHNAITQDITANNWFMNGIDFEQCTGAWAYRCTCNVTYAQQSYSQWQVQFANTTDSGCTDCTISSCYIQAGFASFSAMGTQFIRPTLINTVFDVNNVGNFLLQDAVITINSTVVRPGFALTQPLIDIDMNTVTSTARSTAFGSLGGTVSNVTMTQLDYVSSNNDTLRGLIIDLDIQNVTITSGSYAAPNYSAPSTMNGPVGIASDSTASTISVSNFMACGVLRSTTYNVTNANIGLTNGTITNCMVTNGAIVNTFGTITGTSSCP